MNYYKSAITRKSTRDFKDKAVSASIIKEVTEYFKVCKKLVPEIDVELMVIDPKVSPQMNGCAGYQDFLIEAPHYMLLTSDKTDYYLENAGFIGEDLVLKLTELGIASCWVTITDSQKLKERLRIFGDKVPVALIAFGYENSISSVKRLDILNRSNVILKKRSNYEAPKLYIDDSLYSEDMGIKADHSVLDHYTDLYQALVSACCAPSFLNRQPYRFVIKNGTLMLVALQDDMTDEDDYLLNLGIVMLNFYGALSERSGVYGNWKLGTDNIPEVEIPAESKITASIKI